MRHDDLSEACENQPMKAAVPPSTPTTPAHVMTRRAILLFGIMAVVWGIPYLFIRVAVDEMAPSVLVFARTGIAALILVPIAITRTDYRAVLARWRWVVAFAVIEMGIPWVLLGTAEKQIPSALAGLLVAGVPLVATVLAVGTGGRDRIGRTGVAGLLVGLIGVAAVVGVNLDTSNVPALLAMAVVVAGYATGPAIMSRRLGGLSTISVMALSLSLCALVYAPIAFVQRPAVIPSPAALGAVLVLAVVCTASAFLLFWALIDQVGPVRATVITYLNPAVAALLGVGVLSESFTPGMGLGFALVILGSVLATRPAGSRSLWPLSRSRGQAGAEHASDRPPMAGSSPVSR
jgi:drug/metabolite transporter (DMT)-like permease